MQLLKPQALGLSTRPVEFRKRYGLSISAYLHVPFEQGERGALWSEQSMWNFLVEEMGVPMIDEGVAKLTPEFLVHGHAYPTPERPNACAVRARLAEREKTLVVFGDRYWDGGRASAPQPFASMPLTWNRAYGGAEHAANMAGRGLMVQDGVRWLPNLEMPHDRLLRPDQSVTPAGFGALDVMHPQRVPFRGTYDGSYLKEHSPGFAPDLDWRYFNIAPADQWLSSPLRGDEGFSFENMHPQRPRIDGRLPGLRARVFASYALPDGEQKLREVPLRLTTVWFFPHEERAVLICQGLAEVGTDDGSDVLALLGAVERLGEVKDDAHYARVIELRNDPKMGAVHCLRDSDLLPDGLSIYDPAVEEARKGFAMEGLQADAQYRRAQTDVAIAREQARELGHDPDALGIQMPPREVPPAPDEMAAHLQAQIELMEQQQWAVVDDALTQLEKAMAFAQEHDVDLAALHHRGPPVYRAAQQWDELVAGYTGSRMDNPPTRADIYPKLQMKEDAERLAYLQSAHAQPPALRLPSAEAASLRDEMRRAPGLGLRKFQRLDFTGADFSGLDLRGVDFTGAWLESVDFSNANLSGATLSHAVLAHANFTGTIAVGAKCEGANFGKAVFARAVFDDADLGKAILVGCQFAGSQMQRANIAGALLLDTRWGPAQWSGVKAVAQTFYKLDLAGVVWTQADLSGCTFIECSLVGSDLRGANLAGTTFATCRMEGVQLVGAQCEGVVFAKGCGLASADFSGAVLRGCNFDGADLRGARGVRTVFDGANLSGANISRADFRLSSAKSALLRKTNCAQANLAGIDFSQAVLQHADLRGADLRRSNLFGADLSRIRLDGSVQLDDALLLRARTYPRLTQAEQEAA